MTARPARLRLRRRLLIYSAPLIIVALLAAAKLISVVVVGNSAVSAFAGGDGNAVRADAGVLGVANVVEPAKAPFAAGTAALDRTDATRSCPVRVNLELVRETQGDRAASAGDRARAEERYTSALTIVGDAPQACFAGNNDPDPQRRAIRDDAANRLAAKRTGLTAPPPALPPPPPPAAPPPPPPPPPLIAPDGREIPARQLDPGHGDPLDKLLQVLQDAADAAPPGEQP
jgi:hypothetical protein